MFCLMWSNLWLGYFVDVLSSLNSRIVSLEIRSFFALNFTGSTIGFNTMDPCLVCEASFGIFSRETLLLSNLSRNFSWLLASSPQAPINKFAAKRPARSPLKCFFWKVTNHLLPTRHQVPQLLAITTHCMGQLRQKVGFWDFGWCQVWPLNDLFKSFWPPSVSSKHPPLSR